MIETFEERCKRKLQTIIADQIAKTIISKIDPFLIQENKILLKLLGDVLTMEFLPKKQDFIKELQYYGIRFTSRVPKTNIEAPEQVIFKLTRELGINLPFDVIRDNCFTKGPQKQRKNKYLNLDLLK